jgi:archaellum component FlaG (FlaF/FlaG flagellin family)
MPATSATQLIFFIAAIIIALSLVGVFTVVTDQLKDALQNRAESERLSVRSKVEIINDLVAMPYNNTTKALDIYVKNVGGQRLFPNQTLVLIDGIDHNYTWRVVGGSANWTQGLTVVLTVEDCAFSADTDHAVMVTCSYGAQDRKEFRIGALP